MKKLLAVMMIMMMVLAGCAQKPADDIYDNEETRKDAPVIEAEKDEKVAMEDEKVDEAVEAEEEGASEEVPAEPVELKVIMPYGTPTLSMVKMMTENTVIAENVTVDYEALAATDVLTSMLINKEADLAIVPTNLAAVLYSKNAGYKIVGPSGWGSFYIVSSEEIVSMEGLKDQTVSLIGRNLTPDAMLRYLLTEKGMNPDEDLTLEYFAGASELAANYIGGQTNVGMIPQPVLTSVLMKRDDSKVVIDLQEVWSEVTGLGNYPQASLIVSEELIAENPEVVEAFMDEFDAAVQWVNDNPAEAGAYYEALDIGLNAAIIAKAIPGANLDFMPASEAKDSLDAYLNVLFDFNPKLLGGQPVEEALYFEK